MSSTRYRSANIIILSILEVIIRTEPLERSNQEGILKSHLIKHCNLKSKTADKYLDKMEKAGYVLQIVQNWGKREIIVYQITEIGLERYEWFLKINTELE